LHGASGQPGSNDPEGRASGQQAQAERKELPSDLRRESAEGDALLVVESGARRVVRVPIEENGAAGPVTVVADLTGSQPDGIALAVDGTMFVGCYRPDRIYRVPPGGSPEIWVEDPDGVILNQPANPVFVGPGLDRLLVTSLGGWNLVTADPGVTGLPLRYPTF